MDTATLEARLNSLEQQVEELTAKEEVRALLLEYCRLNDATTEADALTDLFTDDANYTNASGQMRGKEAIREYLNNFYNGSVKFARHHMLQPVITITEPGVAHIEAYFIALLGKGGTSVIAIGHYDDIVKKTEAGWKYVDKRNNIVGSTTPAQGWGNGFLNAVPVEGEAA